MAAPRISALLWPVMTRTAIDRDDHRFHATLEEVAEWIEQLRTSAAESRARIGETADFMTQLRQRIGQLNSAAHKIVGQQT
jgi:hypothetical protein